MLVSTYMHFTTSLLISVTTDVPLATAAKAAVPPQGTMTHLFYLGLLPFTLHTGPLFDMYPHKPRPVMPMSDTEFREGMQSSISDCRRTD